MKNDITNFEKVEKRLGVRLPDSYKAFVQRYGSQKVQEGRWVEPQHLEVLDNFESVGSDLQFLDAPTRDLRRLVPVLIDEIAGDLLMLDYRTSDSPQVFTLKAQSQSSDKKFETFSHFLDAACKNYVLKSQYLDVIELNA